MTAAAGADAAPSAVARRLKVATGVDCGAVYSASTFAETEGGVYGELSPGAFPKIAQCLAGLGLWQASGNVCLDFGHGFGRFAVGALLEAPAQYAADWLGIELVEARHAHAMVLQEQLAAEAAIEAGQLAFHCGDFMTLPASHPVVARPTVVIGYDVWMYKAATGEGRAGAAAAASGAARGGGGGGGGVYSAYAAQLARMPHLRAVVTCCYRNRDLRAVLESRAFRYRATLKLPTRGNDLQTALVFDRAPEAPQPPFPIDGRGVVAAATSAAASRPPRAAVGGAATARAGGGAASLSSLSSSPASGATSDVHGAGAVDVLAAVPVTARGKADGSTAAAAAAAASRGAGTSSSMAPVASASGAIETIASAGSHHGASVGGRKRARAAGDAATAAAVTSATEDVSPGAAAAATTVAVKGSAPAHPKRRRLAS